MCINAEGEVTSLCPGPVLGVFAFSSCLNAPSVSFREINVAEKGGYLGDKSADLEGKPVPWFLFPAVFSRGMQRSDGAMHFLGMALESGSKTRKGNLGASPWHPLQEKETLGGTSVHPLQPFWGDFRSEVCEHLSTGHQAPWNMVGGLGDLHVLLHCEEPSL